MMLVASLMFPVDVFGIPLLLAHALVAYPVVAIVHSLMLLPSCYWRPCSCCVTAFAASLLLLEFLLLLYSCCYCIPFVAGIPVVADIPAVAGITAVAGIPAVAGITAVSDFSSG